MLMLPHLLLIGNPKGILLLSMPGPVHVVSQGRVWGDTRVSWIGGTTTMFCDCSDVLVDVPMQHKTTGGTSASPAELRRGASTH